jgi:hypothetical protein
VDTAEKPSRGDEAGGHDGGRPFSENTAVLVAFFTPPIAAILTVGLAAATYALVLPRPAEVAVAIAAGFNLLVAAVGPGLAGLSKKAPLWKRVWTAVWEAAAGVVFYVVFCGCGGVALALLTGTLK